MTPLTSKGVRRWVASWLSLLLLWLALVGSRDALELVVGLGAALAGGVVVAAVRASGGFPALAFRRRTWSRAAIALARIPRDLWLLAGGVRLAGSISVSRLPEGTDWRRRAERGFAELFGSLAPNAIVVDASPDGRTRVHELVEVER